MTQRELDALKVYDELPEYKFDKVKNELTLFTRNYVLDGIVYRYANTITYCALEITNVFCRMAERTDKYIRLDIILATAIGNNTYSTWKIAPTILIDDEDPHKLQYKFETAVLGIDRYINDLKWDILEVMYNKRPSHHPSYNHELRTRRIKHLGLSTKFDHLITEQITILRKKVNNNA